ncbi:hypothetical protein M422DRAFT_255057 [Sphaerobolus stellatus SS14]|uniref:Uncharacterized protein n=1 Tax=Sphaerobolus stellatus (strain SS14) TaxID=990650 RepID=A0A0C9VJF8_SPHS4|nr:hypothetical protein M422DRAFT_255057 [Sphaerobolus stellatus SS14]
MAYIFGPSFSVTVPNDITPFTNENLRSRRNSPIYLLCRYRYRYATSAFNTSITQSSMHNRETQTEEARQYRFRKQAEKPAGQDVPTSKHPASSHNWKYNCDLPNTLGRNLRTLSPPLRPHSHILFAQITQTLHQSPPSTRMTSSISHRPYASSKAAVHAITDPLIEELRPLGIHVLLIQPGSIRTQMVPNSQLKPANTVQPLEYVSYHVLCAKVLASVHGKQPGDPQKAVNIIADIVRGEGCAVGSRLVAARRAQWYMRTVRLGCGLSRMLSRVRGVRVSRLTEPAGTPPAASTHDATSPTQSEG